MPARNRPGADLREAIRRQIADMTPQERVRRLQSARRRKQAKQEAPLAFAQCWHQSNRPPEYSELLGSENPTSQREAARELMQWSVLIAILLGGNRSGKTEFGAQWAIAMSLGKDHPHVRGWIARNGWDWDEVGIPEGPGTVWAGSVTFDDSLEYVRPKVAKYLPRGCRWRNRDASNQATVTMPNGGKIVFKAYSQGRRKWQGKAIRACWMDEEPDDEGLVEEAQMRLVDQGGRMLFTMTPLMGLTWIYHRWVEPWERGEVTEGQHVAEIVGLDNPHIDQEFLAGKLRAMSEHLRRQRGQGRFTAAEGLIYPMWSPSVHVIEVPWDQPPPDWPCWVAIDFGASHPFCCTWFTQHPNGQIIAYREHYLANATLAHHAQVIRDSERCRPCNGAGTKTSRRGVAMTCPDCHGRGHENIVRRWADPEDLQARIDLETHGIYTEAAKKGPGSVKAGIISVQTAMATSAQGSPGFAVVRGSCPNGVREIRAYQWEKPSTPGKPTKDQPRKVNDDAMDTWRYGINEWLRYGDVMAVA